MSGAAYVRPVDAVSVADRVTSEIRRAVISGRLRPGQEFSLRQIAAQLGVSFIPVREALRSLEAEGLLVIRRGRSAAVAPLLGEELHGICQLRRRIEPELAGRACPLVEPSRLDALGAALERARALGPSAEERYDTHLALLHGLLSPAATDWDLRMLRILWRATERYLWAGCVADTAPAGRDGADPDGFVGAQRELLDAFRGGDPKPARRAMLTHLEWIEQTAERGVTEG